MMTRAEIYPFASVGDGYGKRYPSWLRGLKTANGAYIIRERDSGEVVYIGESHSSRLYGTLTRHFQYWSPAFDTAGPTYERTDVEVAVIVVPTTHAYRMQNDLMCALGPPRDNRVVCALHDVDRDPDDPALHPRGYDYDVEAIIAALFGDESPNRPDVEDDDEIPF